MKKLSKRKKNWIERTVSNDRSYKVVLYNRLFVYGIFVVLQLVMFGFLLFSLAHDSAIGVAVQAVISILSLVFVVYLLNVDTNASVRTGWIIAILVAPVFGVPLYLFNGRGRPTRKLRKRLQCAKAEIAEQTKDETDGRKPVQAQGRGQAITALVENYAGYPVYTDGEVRYFASGEEMFPAMLEALKTAEKYILVEYFIIAHGRMWNEILKILLEKAMQGVRVRIIYDDFGCIVTLPPDYEKYLESLHENIQCVTFNEVVPVFAVRMNNRDHRKMLVIDGKVAFTGGVNIADEYINEKKRFGYWKDTGIKITGNAVRSFVKMFFYLYNGVRAIPENVNDYLLPLQEENPHSAVRIQPYDDSPLDELPIAELVYGDMIDCAKDYVWICTPYLVLDDKMRETLCRASMRGVDVRIVTPAIPDKKTTYRLTRANYEVLLSTGVKIYEYTPGFIHAKSIIADGNRAVVGTVNFDYRSFYHHFENAVYFAGCDAVNDVKKDYEQIFAVSKQRTAENYKRSRFGRIIDGILRTFETLF